MRDEDKDLESDIEVEIDDDSEEDAEGIGSMGDSAYIEMNLDGEIEEPSEEEEVLDHNRNIAEELDEETLRILADEIHEAVDEDKQSMSDWYDIAEKAIRALGYDVNESRNEPFPGASAVRDPLLAQVCTDFTATIGREFFPKTGPVRANWRGESDDPNKNEYVGKSQQYANGLLLYGLPDYRDGFDQHLVFAALFGTSIRKIYGSGGSAVAENVEPGDFVVPPSASSLLSTQRKTHVLRLYEHEMNANVKSGLWLPIDEDQGDESNESDSNELRSTQDNIVGIDKVSNSDGHDERYVFYEVHLRALSVEDGEAYEDCPYIVTYHEPTRQIVSIRRNWREEDELKNEIQYFVAYRFAPWRGFWGLGLIHLIGQLGDAATGALRILMDTSATNSIPGGFISKSLEIGEQGGSSTISPFKYTTVKTSNAHVQGGEDITKLIFPFPTKEPSPVLFQLVQFLTERGLSYGNTAIRDMASASEQAPVGTMLAVVENDSITYSSVHRRMLEAFSKELQLIQAIEHNQVTLTELGATQIDIAHSQTISVEAMQIDPMWTCWVPAADPNTYSTIQRIAQAQSVHQLATQAKSDGIEVDIRESYIRMAAAMGHENPEELFPEAEPPPEAQPMNPAEEYRTIMLMGPEPNPDMPMPKAFKGQHHASHIAFHTLTLNDSAYSKYLDDNKRAAIHALISDHVSMQRIEELELALGTQIEESQVPPELQPHLSEAIARAANELFVPINPDKDDEFTVDNAIKVAELEQRERDSQRKAEVDLAKTHANNKTRIEDREIQSQTQLATSEVDAEANLINEDLRQSSEDARARLRAETDLNKEELKALNSQSGVII